jgi:hypothetical protein
VAAGVAQRTGGKVGRDLFCGIEAAEIPWVEADGESVGDEARPARDASLGVHRALDPAEDLKGLQARAEEACARAFHETLEKALHA